MSCHKVSAASPKWSPSWRSRQTAHWSRCRRRQTGSSYRTLGDDPKPALHLIQPVGIGRRVVDMDVWPLRQPSFHLGVHVRAVVVYNQVDAQINRNRCFNLAQKAYKLLMTVPWLALGFHLTRFHIEGGKQSGCTLADVVRVSHLQHSQDLTAATAESCHGLGLGSEFLSSTYRTNALSGGLR